MVRYLKMKHNELKVKMMFYGVLAGFIDNRQDVITLLQNLFFALKDVPAEDLQKEFLNNLAEIIHSENKKTNR